MNEFINSLSIVIVIYNTALEDSESFESVLKMSIEGTNIDVFVYDNSLSMQKVKNYKGLDICYFHDPENSGVSKAYNSGAKHAKNKGKDWILLLDQDTKLPKSILQKYRQEIIVNTDINLFVPVLKLKNGNIFSPSRYRFKRGFFLDTIKPGIYSLFNLAPVNSGMMIMVDAFFKVGGYNEKVKLDFADFQFVERFRKRYSNFIVIDVECDQDFSDDNISLESQQVRFKFYCEGAKNIENMSIVDWLQYNAVVLIRALRLTQRFGKSSFIITYLKSFLFASKA